MGHTRAVFKPVFVYLSTFGETRLNITFARHITTATLRIMTHFDTSVLFIIYNAQVQLNFAQMLCQM